MTDGCPGVIDVHAHCVPHTLPDRIRRDGGRLGISAVRTDAGMRWDFGGGFISAPIEPALLDLPDGIARMDAHGIAIQLLSSFIDVGAHHLAGGQATDYARMFNDELAASVAAHPARLRGLATLPTRDPSAAADELQRAVTELGFVGAQIAARDAGGPALEPLWETAATLRAIIFVHPEASTTSRLPFFLGNFVGNPAQTTVAAAALIMSGVLERHPDLVVVLAHGGGFLPYQIGRLRHGLSQYGAAFGALLTESPATQLRRLHYDTILHDPAALAALVGAVGADRVLAGTDDPFAMGDPDPLASIREVRSLNEYERRLIVEDNATRLLSAVRAHPSTVGVPGSPSITKENV